MRRLLLSFALAASLSAVGASSALAAAPEGAQKAPLYGPFGFVLINCATGGTPTPKTFGFAVLDTPGDETTLSGEIALKHAAPHATYSVLVVQGVCSTFSPVGDITTNKKGNGNLHFTTPRTLGTETFFVDVDNTAAVESFVSPAVELD